MSRKTTPDCPACNAGILRALDSRSSSDPSVLRRRRRQCDACDYRCSTHEMIVKDNAGFVKDTARSAREFLALVRGAAVTCFGEDVDLSEPHSAAARDDEG